MKFGELAKQQLKNSKNQLTEQTYETFRWMIKYYITPYLENYDIEDINDELLEENFRKEFLDKLKAEDYVKNAAIKMVKSMIKKAKEENNKDNKTSNETDERQ